MVEISADRLVSGWLINHTEIGISMHQPHAIAPTNCPQQEKVCVITNIHLHLSVTISKLAFNLSRMCRKQIPHSKH